MKIEKKETRLCVSKCTAWTIYKSNWDTKAIVWNKQ